MPKTPVKPSIFSLQVSLDYSLTTKCQWCPNAAGFLIEIGLRAAEHQEAVWA